MPRSFEPIPALRDTGATIATVATALGVGLAVGMLVAAVSEPRWTVGGGPWVSGNAKNVDLRATLAAVAAGAATALLGGRGARLTLGLVALVALTIAAARWPAALPAAALAALAAGGLAVALEHGFLRAGQGPAGDCGIVWPWLLALAAILFLGATEPLSVDVFHHGEVLATGLDLVRGGRPFETIAWPHGAHDSGLAALWMVLTGKVGSSPVILARATTAALAAVPLYALVRRATGDRRAALLGAWLSVAGLVVIHPPASPQQILGTLAFPILALVLATARPPRPAAAGAMAGLALVFRIDAGTYGLAALAVALSAGALLEPAPFAARVRRLAGRAAGAALACAATLLLLRLLLGWPTAAWYAHLFGSLPRYHSIANGLPYPWPVTGRATLAGWLALGLPALAATLAAVAARAARRGVAPDRVALLGGVAVLALGALRTGLGRSDLHHLLHYGQPVALLAALLAAGAGLRWLAERRRLAAALLAVVAAGLVVDVAGHPRQSVRQLRQHLAANPPVGACGDTFFTPLEAARGDVRALIEASCDTERQLRQAGVRRLVIGHSAPWYYVRFGMPLPSPYYSFNRAALPDQQQQVIDDLRASGADALLQARGFNALDRYDVGDGFRVPLIAAYLRERRGDAPLLATPIGDLALWNKPAAAAGERPAAPAPRGGPSTSPLRAVYDPVTRFLAVSGRTGDPAAGRPSARFEGAVTDLQSQFDPDGSFRLLTRLPAGVATPPPLVVVVESADGTARRIRVPTAAITVLPPLSGEAAGDLAARTDAAAAAGRADRAAALGK